MSLNFLISAQFASTVGRTPRSGVPSGDDAPVGLSRGKVSIPRAKSGSRGTRADRGIRPTSFAQYPNKELF
jgi:hypothetical protein